MENYSEHSYKYGNEEVRVIASNTHFGKFMNKIEKCRRQNTKLPAPQEFFRMVRNKNEVIEAQSNAFLVSGPTTIKEAVEKAIQRNERRASEAENGQNHQENNYPGPFNISKSLARTPPRSIKQSDKQNEDRSFEEAFTLGLSRISEVSTELFPTTLDPNQFPPLMTTPQPMEITTPSERTNYNQNLSLKPTRDLEELKNKYGINTEGIDADVANLFGELGDIMTADNTKMNRKTQKDVLTIFFKMSELIKELREEAIIRHNQKEPGTAQNQQTYAQATKNKKTNYLPKGKNNRQVVLIEAKDPNRKPEEIRKEIITKCNPASEQIKVIKTTVTRTKKIAVQCESNKDAEKIINLVKEKTDLEATKPTKLNPRVIVFNIPEDYERDQLAPEIQRQNNIEGQIKPIFSYKNKNGRNWILETEPTTYHQLMKEKKIYIGLNRCSIDNYTKPTICNKCCRIGHTAKICTARYKC